MIGSTVGWVTCPRCKAKPGEPCRTAKGAELRRPDPGLSDEARLFHEKRMLAFVQFRRGRPKLKEAAP